MSRPASTGDAQALRRHYEGVLVGSITTLAIVLLFWPVIDKVFGNLGRLWRLAKATG